MGNDNCVLDMVTAAAVADAAGVGDGGEVDAPNGYRVVIFAFNCQQNVSRNFISTPSRLPPDHPTLVNGMFVLNNAIRIQLYCSPCSLYGHMHTRTMPIATIAKGECI